MALDDDVKPELDDDSVLPSDVVETELLGDDDQGLYIFEKSIEMIHEICEQYWLTQHFSKMFETNFII